MLKFNSEKKDLWIGKIDDRLDQIRERISQSRGTKWLSFTLSVPEIDPLAYLEQNSSEDTLFYWERPDSRQAIAAGGAVHAMKATGENRFEEMAAMSNGLQKQLIAASAAGISNKGPVLVGGYSFSDHNIHERWKHFGAAKFILPEWTLERENSQTLLTLTRPIDKNRTDRVFDEMKAGVLQFFENCRSIEKSSFNEGGKNLGPGIYKTATNPGAYDEWEKKVNRCRNLIENGQFQKIVIARNLNVETENPIHAPLAVYHLRETFPECFNFLVKMEGGPTFMGATPERLITLKRRRINTEGLAGSISRGQSAVEDVALGKSLLKNGKDRSEHQFVVKDICNSLQPYSHRIDFPEKPVVKKLNNVQHLYTPISAVINEKYTIHEIAGALHPTPAVGGYPKSSSIPFINEIEQIDRGWYAGPVGWFNLDGSGEFAVAIRSAWINKSDARLFAGCGIVKNSDPQKEWKETELKLRPILGALKKATSE